MRGGRARSWTATFTVIACLALSVVRSRGSSNYKQSPRQLNEFYVVEVWEDDSYPYWQSAIIQLKPHGDGAALQYFYIGSATQPCDDSTIKGEAVIFPKRKLEDLTNDVNLCEIDEARFNQNVERYSKKLQPFHTTRSSVVAYCSDGPHIFRMPTYKMDEQRLSHAEPEAAKMSSLLEYLAVTAFPADRVREILWGVDASLVNLLPESPEVREIKAGHFDDGYWLGGERVHPAIPAEVVTTFDPSLGSDSDIGKLRYVLNRYRYVPINPAQRTGSLVDSSGLKLKEFVAPIYPPIAQHLHIQGKVELSLLVNRATGQVEKAEVLSGHDLLKFASTESALHWKFEVSPDLPEKIVATLDYSLHCGA